MQEVLFQIMPLVLIFFVFYFLIIRPQQNKVKEHAAMVAAVKKGDEVGRFMLGSTVVVCFGKNKVDWLNKITANSIVKMGQCVGKF